MKQKSYSDKYTKLVYKRMPRPSFATKDIAVVRYNGRCYESKKGDKRLARVEKNIRAEVDDISRPEDPRKRHISIKQLPIFRSYHYIKMEADFEAHKSPEDAVNRYFLSNN
uniref:Integrase n=1 Tax=Globodera pallida TaxID=36090 RepID=A0A183BQM4_GLOPA